MGKPDTSTARTLPFVTFVGYGNYGCELKLC